ncbi:hypothetical protein OQI_33865 [Streptomyces pharetrae CZA14]|uniref:Uncharacterized protein n=1 Tax=Streptomyces pharetrae CZA14 TaxID=1144883 RepID=A0ABX3YBH3_9ACTN|nr:hypothetical protein OQI_33865 [Streptomyces pharetrae CZA14]
MSYKPHIQVRYQIDTDCQIPAGRTVVVRDQPGSRSVILLAPGHASEQLAQQITRLSGHQIVHGSWRQRWTTDGRMQRPAQGLGLAVSRWERVPGDMLPAGRIVLGVEHDGSCVWLIDEDECSRQLQNDMNDLLYRLAGDGLWLQVWFRRRPQLAGPGRYPLHAPPAAPLAQV